MCVFKSKKLVCRTFQFSCIRRFPHMKGTIRCLSVCVCIYTHNGRHVCGVFITTSFAALMVDLGAGPSLWKPGGGYLSLLMKMGINRPPPPFSSLFSLSDLHFSSCLWSSAPPCSHLPSISSPLISSPISSTISSELIVSL